MRKIVSENNLVFIITDQGLFYNNIPLEYIDKGEEGSVYRYQDKAIKIYHDYPRKTTASLELLKVLKTINTQRILMPIDILMETSNKAKGYITPFIEGNKDIVYNYVKKANTQVNLQKLTSFVKWSTIVLLQKQSTLHTL